MELILQLDKTADIPLFQQIYQQLRQLILNGTLRPGRRLPATRRLATRHGVARVTVLQAYGQLEVEGFVEGRAGAGTYVVEHLPLNGRLTTTPPEPFQPHFSRWGERVLSSPLPKKAPAERPDIDFGFGRSFPHIFPYDIWRRILGRYLSTDDVMLSRYGSVAGFAPLREAVASYLTRLRGVNCSPDQVVIVSGAQQALDILARLLLEPGDEVLVETPGYRAGFDVFQALGAQLAALPVDDHGFPVEKIDPSSSARLAFVTPSNQFPRGGTMPLSRRLALLRWASERNGLIVEDDYDGELRYDGRPLSALQGLDKEGRVVYLGTFSKVLFPALRLGYVVLPPTLHAAFVRAKGLVDRGAPTLTQAAVADFMAEGHFEAHLRQLRKAYQRRWEVLTAALDCHLGSRVSFCRVPAGLHVMVYLDAAHDEAAVVAKTAVSGVRIYAGAPYHLEPSPPPSILLGFSGLNEVEIEEGVRRLAQLLD